MLSRAADEDGALGSQIREFRQRAGLSLQALADLTGVTRSFLSTVELGRSHPSIPVLRRIAMALNVPIFLLLRESKHNGIVVRREARRILAEPRSDVSYELLSPDLRHQMEVIIMRLRPGRQAAPAMSHEGEECATVLRGRVKVTVAGEEHLLEPGDTIYFNSGLPHSTENVGDSEAELISAITPPSF